MVGLAHRRAIPLEPEPVEVGDRGGNMLFARAGAVDIVDAEQERAAGAVRGIVRQNRAIGVAEVEFAGRAGGEAGQHGAGAESRYCVLKAAILPYLATKPRSEEHTSELQSLMRISYA